MATTTPNFGWPVPTSTDLVKDGATAIEALGDGIDTSLVDLKGGTTGQVLAKATNADMDFAWVAADDTNAIQNAIVDAKGDLIAASAADTPARLAVGANGETLVADSSATTGLRWQSGVNSNYVINGNFDIWQRSTNVTITSSGYAAADRWYSDNGGSTILSRQTTGAPAGSTYVLRTQINGGAVANTVQAFESEHIAPLRGRTVVFSIRLRRNGTFAGNLTIAIDKNSTSNASPSAAGWSQIAGTAITNANLPTGTTSSDWYFASVSATIPNDGTANSLRVSVAQSAGESSGAYYEMAQAQLEIGSVATAFKRAGGTLAGELAACQRYYTKSYDLATAPATATSNGSLGLAVGTNSAAANYFTLGVTPPVAMRTAPVITLYDLVGNSGKVTTVSATDLSLTDNVTGTADRIGEKAFRVYVAANARGGFYVHYVASAEL